MNKVYIDNKGEGYIVLTYRGKIKSWQEVKVGNFDVDPRGRRTPFIMSLGKVNGTLKLDGLEHKFNFELGKGLRYVRGGKR